MSVEAGRWEIAHRGREEVGGDAQKRKRMFVGPSDVGRLARRFKGHESALGPAKGLVRGHEAVMLGSGTGMCLMSRGGGLCAGSRGTSEGWGWAGKVGKEP